MALFLHEDIAMDFQFYPTSESLVKRCWNKFKNTDFIRVLEPSAGNGDLCEHPWKASWRRGPIPIDTCEIDVTRHATLRSKGVNVVGLDFLNFENGACYSHIIMNPPYSCGAKHLLKAWELLWEGEIVCQLNAETIRNPHTRERQMLCRLIDLYGDVEFIPDAYRGEDVEREADVEVALVYLCKRVNITDDVVGNIIGDLRKDTESEKYGQEYETMQAVAVPASYIENSVLAFKAAVIAMRESVTAEARANYYSALLGVTMAERLGNASSLTSGNKSNTVDFVRAQFGSRYDELKDKAWASILRCADIDSRLSSGARNLILSEFEHIKQLEFTVVNIYGFLCGLVENQGNMQVEMACEVFDMFTRYHSENAVWYRGWRSNDAHRTCGMRLKTKRFILPGYSTDSFSRGLEWRANATLKDLDKVLAMMDGKISPEYGLVQAFAERFNDLRNGKRISTSYFDIRYYSGVGTIHFFPTRKDLIDRLNRWVGAHRKWLPEDPAEAHECFWQQYEAAEKYDSALQNAVNSGNYGWQNPFYYLTSADKNQRDDAHEVVDASLAEIQAKDGLQDIFRIAKQPQQQTQQALLPLVA